MELKIRDPKKLKNWKWPFQRINSGGDVEFACPHGIGHGGIHGCDGCCGHVSYYKWRGIHQEKFLKKIRIRLRLLWEIATCELHQCSNRSYEDLKEMLVEKLDKKYKEWRKETDEST